MALGKTNEKIARRSIRAALTGLQEEHEGAHQMGIDAAVQSKPFKFDRLQLHFIYSFCLANGDEPLYAENVSRLLGKRGWTATPPVDRQGIIAPFLMLKLVRAFKGIQFGTATIAERRVRLSGLLRLFSAGGTFTLSMELEPQRRKQYDTDDVHALMSALHFSRRPGGTQIRCAKRVGTAYALFKEVLEEECAGLSSLGLGLKVNAYDAARGLLDPMASVTQSPWLVTTFQVSGPEHDAFCTGTTDVSVVSAEAKARNILPYYHDLAPILFRSVTGKDFPVEPTYRGREAGIDSRNGSQLSNMHLDARLFACSSRRNVLCVTGDIEAEPASYFLPGVLGINEMVRARWHALIILNRNLDHILAGYRGESTSDDPEKLRSRRGMKLRRERETRHLHDILVSRRWIAPLLDDPGIYTIAGDALAALYERGKEVFKLDELRTLLLQKAELVDRMQSDQSQLAWV